MNPITTEEIIRTLKGIRANYSTNVIPYINQGYYAMAITSLENYSTVFKELEIEEIGLEGIRSKINILEVLKELKASLEVRNEKAIKKKRREFENLLDSFKNLDALTTTTV